MGVDEYTKEDEWQLNNQEHYKKLKSKTSGASYKNI